MTASHISGPSIVYGNPGTTKENPEAGPSAAYQGTSILDPRLPYQPGTSGRGAVRSFADSPYIYSVDAIPSASGPAVIAAAATATSGTPLALVGTNTPGRGVNFPIFPTGISPLAANIVYTTAIDPAFTTISTTAGSATATTTAQNLALFARLIPGMALLVGSAAASWQVVKLVSVTATSLTFDTPMAATNATAPICNATGQFRPDNPSLTFTPSVTAGATRIVDAKSGIARGLSVTSSAAGDTGWSVVVRGYDYFLAPMSETITATPGGIAYGNKCFKFIASVTPAKAGGGVSTGTFSIGTSDLIGFHTRSDQWEYTQVYWAGALMASSAGWFAGDVTMPATSTTKDVRGAIQLTAAGPNGTFIGANATNGVRRLVMANIVPAENLHFASTANPASLFGATQA